MLSKLVWCAALTASLASLSPAQQVPATAADRPQAPSAGEQLYNVPAPRIRKSVPARVQAPIVETLQKAAETPAKQAQTPAQTADNGGPKAISSWPTGRKLVALTYDDGPNPKVTPQLLDLLARKRARATFYLLGEMVREYPTLARKVAESGCEVANHSYNHKQFTKLSQSGLDEQIQRTHDLITSATGARIRTLRPPYGSTNSRVNQYCDEMGYRVVLWDVDTNDWRKRSTEQIVSTIMNETRDGSIILMHDRLPTTVEATEAVIDGLRARGYEFVTVAELLAHPKSQGTGTPKTSTSTAMGGQPARTANR